MQGGQLENSRVKIVEGLGGKVTSGLLFTCELPNLWKDIQVKKMQKVVKFLLLSI